MNELESIALHVALDAPAQRALRHAFALACVERVEHLFEREEAHQCLREFAGHVRSRAGHAEELPSALRERAAALAGSHPGSRSIDGCGHAAVSATYALAKAVAGQAVQAAGYAAYAAVYAQGGAAAVAEPGAMSDEQAWQAQRLMQLARQT